MLKKLWFGSQELGFLSMSCIQQFECLTNFGKGKEVRRKYYQDNKEAKQRQSREYQRKRRELFKEYERLVNEQRAKAQKEEPKTS